MLLLGFIIVRDILIVSRLSIAYHMTSDFFLLKFHRNYYLTA